mmetsp:Transcript_515/g.1371  ORF Transcript_515/g.1371 Transcript_515/m.1371 type:complete len:200 (-) Transcript_515:903-1502(-)
MVPPRPVPPPGSKCGGGSSTSYASTASDAASRADATDCMCDGNTGTASSKSTVRPALSPSGPLLLLAPAWLRCMWRLLTGGADRNSPSAWGPVYTTALYGHTRCPRAASMAASQWWPTCKPGVPGREASADRAEMHASLTLCASSSFGGEVLLPLLPVPPCPPYGTAGAGAAGVAVWPVEGVWALPFRPDHQLAIKPCC